MCSRNFLMFCLLISLLTACSPSGNSGNDPKKRLTEYISRSFAVHSIGDRQALTEYMTGNAKYRLVAWSDEQFQQAFIDSKRQFLKLAFRDVKELSSQAVSITYEVTYIDQGKGHDAKVTNKKLCQLVLERGKWYISEVHNIKELVEYKNEMALP